MLMDEASLRPPIGDVLAVVGAVVTAHLNEGALTGPLPVTVGELVSLPAGDGRAVGIVHNLRKGRRLDDVAVAEIHLLGEIKPSDGAAVFRRGLTAHPALDAPVARVTPGESSVVYAQPSVASVRVGSLRRDPQVPAFVLPDALLGKHFAILGSTGSGKSCAVTVVLRAILASTRRPTLSSSTRTASTGTPSASVRSSWTRPASSCPTGSPPSRRPRASWSRATPAAPTPRRRSWPTPSCAPRRSASASSPTTPTSPSTRRSPTASPTSAG